MQSNSRQRQQLGGGHCNDVAGMAGHTAALASWLTRGRPRLPCLLATLQVLTGRAAVASRLSHVIWQHCAAHVVSAAERQQAWQDMQHMHQDCCMICCSCCPPYMYKQLQQSARTLCSYAVGMAGHAAGAVDLTSHRHVAYGAGQPGAVTQRSAGPSNCEVLQA